MASSRSKPSGSFRPTLATKAAISTAEKPVRVKSPSGRRLTATNQDSMATSSQPPRNPGCLVARR
jgi:hypothetical protein